MVPGRCPNRRSAGNFINLMAVKPTSAPQPTLAGIGLAITEHAPSPIAVVEGPQHIARHVNAAFGRLLRKPAAQLIGKTFAAIMPEQTGCVGLLNRVHRTRKAASYTETQTSGARPIFWSYLMWPVLAQQRRLGIIVQVIETTELHDRSVAINEALLLGALRQHELTEASELANARLKAELDGRQLLETRRRMDVLTISNQKLKHEIVRRRAVEQALKESERHQVSLLAQSHRMQEQLRNLSRQVLRAQEEERKRISRELHDVIAQTLTGINLRLATLKKEAALNLTGFDRNITRTQRLVEKSVHLVHDFARELRPAVLDDLGLIPALHSFVEIFSKRTRIRVRLKAFAGVEQLDNNKRTVLFRVAQEALTNVARHAKASQVEVNIQKLPGRIGMKITDDGKSFQVDRVLSANRGKRLGLLGMRERVEMVGGNFRIASAPGQGTTIEAQLPLGKSAGGGAADGVR